MTGSACEFTVGAGAVVSIGATAALGLNAAQVWNEGGEDATYLVIEGSFGAVVLPAFGYGSFVNSVVGCSEDMELQPHFDPLTIAHFNMLCLGLIVESLFEDLNLEVMADSSFVSCCPFQI